VVELKRTLEVIPGGRKVASRKRGHAGGEVGIDQ
jgi:hypothetical protein